MDRSNDLDNVLERVLGAPPPQSALAELDARIARAVAERPRRLPAIGRLALALVVLALLLPLAVVAAQALLPATESPYGLAGPDEFQAEIQAAEADVPIPRGETWPPYLAVAYRTGMYSRGGGRVAVEAAAVCIWAARWVDANRRGDVATASAATTVMHQVRGWSYYSGSFSSPSLRDLIDLVIAGIDAGDPGPAQQFIANNCTSGT